MGRDLPPIDTGENEAGQNNAPSAVGSQGTSPADEETLVLPVHAPECTNVPGGVVGDEGLELIAVSKWKITDVIMGNAKSDAFLDVPDRKLRILLQAWADLPESVKAALLVMVGDRTC